MLDIPSSELNAITAGNPTNAKRCCNAMLEKWLEIDTAASWEKIFSAINSPAVSIKCESKGGKSCMILHNYARYYLLESFSSNI